MHGMSRQLLAAVTRGLQQVASRSLGVTRGASLSVQRAAFSSNQTTAAPAELLDPLLLADADPAERLAFASMPVPTVFQQYMRQLKLSLGDRIELLTQLRTSGPAHTAKWMLDNVERFESNVKAQAAPAAAAAPVDGRKASLAELQTEYEHALRRHATRRSRRLALTEQASLSDRVWLAELAEYAETLKAAADSGSQNAAAALPDWARFVMERRALEQFYTYVRTGAWAPIPEGAQREDLLGVLRLLHTGRANPAQARLEAEAFRSKSSVHNELVRRFIEPAIGLMSAEKALESSLAEDRSKVPQNLQASRPKPEAELARLIRLGVAPIERLQFLVPKVFSEAEIEQIVQNDGDLIAEMLQRHSPAHLADVERKALLRPGVQFAHWVRAVEEGKLTPDELANFEPPEYTGPTAAEKAAEKTLIETLTNRPMPSPPVNTAASARAREAELRDSELFFSVRADQVNSLSDRIQFSAALQKVKDSEDFIKAASKMQPKPDAAQIEGAEKARKEAAEVLHSSVLPVTFASAISNIQPAEAARIAASYIGSQAPDNMSRCLGAMEALLQLPIAHHESIIDAFERSKLRVDALPAAKVSEQQIKPPTTSDAVTIPAAEHLERALRLELRLLADIDAARLEMRQRSSRERARETEALKKEAKELGIDINKMQLRDADRIREAVMVVRHAHQYFPKDPVHNGELVVTQAGELLSAAELEAAAAASSTTPIHKPMSLLPTSVESQAVMVLTHLIGLGYPAAEARHVAAIVLANELPPQEAPVIDALERAQLARRRTATLIGQALLRTQLETDQSLTPESIDRTVFAVRDLQREVEARESERADPLGAEPYDDEMGVRNTLLPSLRTAQTLPDNVTDMLGLNPAPADFDGETDLERELERRDHWRRNRWADIMSSRKYEPPRNTDVNPLTNPEIIPQHLDPIVCRQVYDTYKANPTYWTPLRLSCQFRLKLERVEAILTLWYIEDCLVARGELPSFESGERKRVDGGPDDRHFDGVTYLREEFVESSGHFYRDRPEALFLTQEDLERFMWRRSRAFRDFARRPNLFAGETIPSIAGQHRSNRFKIVIQDTSEGRNHPAPLLTVREADGKYRYATEHEYMHEIDTRGVRQRRKEETTWEFEFIRRRLVQAGYHYSLLGSSECPVAGPSAKEAQAKAVAEINAEGVKAAALEAADMAAAKAAKAAKTEL